MQTTLFISIVVITKNRLQALIKCLSYFADQTCSHYEIVVVDSSEASNDSYLKKKFPNIKYYYIGNICSICYSRNYGIKNSTGDIVAFIDDDVEVDRCWIEACVAGYASSIVGGVGGRVIDSETGYLDHKRSAPICRVLKNGLLTDNLDCERDELEYVDHVMGCNMSFRRKVLEQVGYFDENLTTFHDDLDISIRVIRAGYRIVYNSRMTLCHLALPSIYRTDVGRQNELLAYIYLKNYGLKWIKDRGLVTMLFLLSARTGLKNFLRAPSMDSFAYVYESARGKFLGAKKYLLSKRPK